MIFFLVSFPFPRSDAAIAQTSNPRDLGGNHLSLSLTLFVGTIDRPEIVINGCSWEGGGGEWGGIDEYFFRPAIFTRRPFLLSLMMYVGRGEKGALLVTNREQLNIAGNICYRYYYRCYAIIIMEQEPTS